MKKYTMYANLVEVAGIYPAIMGMRNPLSSWNRSDSEIDNYYDGGVMIGPKDMELAKKLIKGGSEHRKFLRQIQVWINIKVPRYLHQELDTYKFGTKNSCSTMHTIAKEPITIDNFYLGDDPIIMTKEHLEQWVIPTMNYFRELYLESNDYRWVKEMKRVCPESFIQGRTWNTNYEELRNIYNQRIIHPHRMNEEWKIIGDVIESLPYAKDLIME